MIELFIMAVPPASITLTELGIVFFLALFLIMAYWKRIPMFNLLAAGVSFYGAWALQTNEFMLIVLIALALFQLMTAYLGIKK